MAKKVIANLKLQIPAGQATPAPPVGPILAQHGLNIPDFCQKFNDATKGQQGFTIPVQLTVYEDKTYSFKLKQPLTSQLLKMAAGIEKGSGEQKKTKAGKISRGQLKEIARKKMADFNTDDVEAAMKIVEGSAKAMGLEITD
jgi:large subunit ribosomal protein L11